MKKKADYKKQNKGITKLENFLRVHFQNQGDFIYWEVGALLERFISPEGNHIEKVARVLNGLIIHYASKQNFKSLPEEIRKHTLNSLYLLHEFIKELAKDEEFFEDLVLFDWCKSFNALSGHQRKAMLKQYSDFNETKKRLNK